ncbi:MAG: bile acid:sodium symporter [Candidatus Thermoplasmatota archaeon]|jgi:ACR3 family arsenite transporter|nr:bile acid:sodium symporter [Candidatus Thermoplasmatota archaeon]MCL5874010.1 bile acid:sodium symporter [Candidatus Thermoplasmatota archaeon]
MRLGKALPLRTILFPVFVMISMILGVELSFRASNYIAGVSTFGIPIGLFFMIYPAMTKVHLKEILGGMKDIRKLGLMVFLNYAIAPFLVAGLGYFFFFEIFERFGLISSQIGSQVLVGIILLGVAPCIAMVMVWTDLAKGNLAAGVSFVAWNSIIQVLTTPFLVYLLARTTLIIDPLVILKSVLLYLVSPLVAGSLTRYLLSRKKYFTGLLNLLGGVQILALMFTIVSIFWSTGSGILDHASLIWMVGVVMLSFYFVLFHLGYFAARKAKFDYPDSTAIGFTVSARDFEISIAIAIVAFAAYPYVILTTAIGPLLEIPLMLMIVWLQLSRRNAILNSNAIKEVSVAEK